MCNMAPVTMEKTGEMMTTNDYRERFVAEYAQTKFRYEKLKKFCDRIEAARITEKDEPPHDSPYDLLREQQRRMGEYLHVLELRAVIENIVM